MKPKNQASYNRIAENREPSLARLFQFVFLRSMRVCNRNPFQFVTICSSSGRVNERRRFSTITQIDGNCALPFISFEKIGP